MDNIKFSPLTSSSARSNFFSPCSIFFLFILGSLPVFSQSEVPVECGHRIADTLELAKMESAINGFQEKSDPTCTEIRVVVHVVFDGSQTNPALSGNISEEQVKSQIRITNMFFRNDSIMHHDENNPLGYTIKLATEDPDGNPTSGIVYHNGTAIFGSAWSTLGLRNTNENAISASQLASEIGWGTDMDGVKYLNSYVVPKIDGNSSYGVQAYAYFPTSNPIYGNYNLANAFGASQLEGEYNQDFELKPFTNLGFTWTHELLHNFGIYHTFQGNSCGAESNCLFMSDRVCDTPPQTQGMGCMGSCGFVSNNVMDYLSQNCKFKITQGQVDRAGLVIQNSLGSYTLCTDCPDNDGDFNGDGTVNIFDLSVMGSAFGCMEDDPCFQSLFDMNCDGSVNIFDASLVSISQAPVNIQLIRESDLEVFDLQGRRVDKGHLSTGIYIVGIQNQIFQKVFLTD